MKSKKDAQPIHDGDLYGRDGELVQKSACTVPNILRFYLKPENCL